MNSWYCDSCEDTKYKGEFLVTRENFCYLVVSCNKCNHVEVVRGD